MGTQLVEEVFQVLSQYLHMREVYGADCVALSKMNLDSYCLEVRSERDSREVYILVYDDGSTSFVSIISDRVRVAYIISGYGIYLIYMCQGFLYTYTYWQVFVYYQFEF